MKTRSKTKTRSKSTKAPPVDYGRLWPLGAGMPGPARGAVLAALPRAARRCLRATCRAGRAAVDACITSVSLLGRDRTEATPALAAAAPRLPALRRVDFGTAYDIAEADAPAAALEALAPALTDVSVSFHRMNDTAHLPWGAAVARLAAALARCPRLEAATLKVPPSTCRGLVARLVDAAPGLTKLTLSAGYGFVAPPETLDLPWHQLQEVEIDSLTPLLPRLCERPGGLPALRGLELGGDMRGLPALWAAPWLTQLTRLELRGWGDHGRGDGGGPLAGLPSAGLELPALQELVVATTYYRAAISPADAACLAACRLPALRRLSLRAVAPGALPPLMGAGWAAGLRDLSLQSGFPTWFGAAGAAALARPSALTRLQVLNIVPRSEDEHTLVPPMDPAAFGALLSAPWAETLQDLRLYGQPLGGGAAGDAAARALAAARLPRLHALELGHASLTAASVAALSAAPWLCGLTALKFDRNPALTSRIGELARLDLRALASFTYEDYSADCGVTGGEVGRLGRAAWLPLLEVVDISVQAELGRPSKPMEHYRAAGAALLDEDGPFKACAARGGQAHKISLAPPGGYSGMYV
ncbi:MAG: hypothetical protein J3K34DRAFT_520437 [Monoraphidium minutum]|nr:MAG: hypothetical protein J3K34DRAFT_520437 [Monoraphidium minutum]